MAVDAVDAAGGPYCADHQDEPEPPAGALCWRGRRRRELGADAPVGNKLSVPGNYLLAFSERRHYLATNSMVSRAHAAGTFYLQEPFI